MKKILLLLLLIPVFLFSQAPPVKVPNLPLTTLCADNDVLIKNDASGLPGTTKIIRVKDFLAGYGLPGGAALPITVAQMQTLAAGLNLRKNTLYQITDAQFQSASVSFYVYSNNDGSGIQPIGYFVKSAVNYPATFVLASNKFSMFFDPVRNNYVSVLLTSGNNCVETFPAGGTPSNNVIINCNFTTVGTWVGRNFRDNYFNTTGFAFGTNDSIFGCTGTVCTINSSASKIILTDCNLFNGSTITVDDANAGTLIKCAINGTNGTIHLQNNPNLNGCVIQGTGNVTLNGVTYNNRTIIGDIYPTTITPNTVAGFNSAGALYSTTITGGSGTTTISGGTGITIQGTVPTYTVVNSSPASGMTLKALGSATVTGAAPNFTLTVGNGQTTSIGAGTGITVTGTAPTYTVVNSSPATGVTFSTIGTVTVTGSAPNFTLSVGNTSISAGTGITIQGTTPTYTVVNSSPDQTVSITAAGTLTVTGTYPSFTINSTSQTTSLSSGTGIAIQGSAPTYSVVNSSPLSSFSVTMTGGNATFSGSILTISVSASGTGNGTVSSFAFTNQNGILGSVATYSTTPILSLTLTAITPQSVAATSSITAVGTITGSNLSGTNTGDQTLSIATNSIAISGQNVIGLGGVTALPALATVGTIASGTIDINAGARIKPLGTATVAIANGTTTDFSGNNTASSSYQATAAITTMTITLSSLPDNGSINFEFFKTTASDLVITYTTPASSTLYVSMSGAGYKSVSTSQLNSTATGLFEITFDRHANNYNVYVTQISP